MVRKLTSWLCGYNVTKDKYPEPWCSAPKTLFTTARDLTSEGLVDGIPEEKLALIKSAPKMGYTFLRALRALRSGKHYIAVKDGTVVVEYHSSKPGCLEVVTYSIEDMSLGGGVFTLSEAGGLDYDSPSVPMSFVAGSSSGVAAAMAIIVGIILSGAKPGCKELAETLADLLPKDNEDDTQVGIIHLFFIAQAIFYKVISPSSDIGWLGDGIGGFSTSGYLSRVTIPDVTALSDGASSLVTWASKTGGVAVKVAAAIQMADRDDTLLFADLIDEDIGKASFSASDPVGVICGGTEQFDNLRKELHLDIHKLTPYEERMVPVMGSNYIVDKKLLKVARDIKDDWKLPGFELATNFILEGDAGSGKSRATKFFASVFGLPWTKLTMSPTFESANLIGAFYPVFNDVEELGVTDEDKKVLEAVKDAMKVSKTDDIPIGEADIVRKIRMAFADESVLDKVGEAYDIPSDEECEIDPDGSWERLGQTSETPDALEVMKMAQMVRKTKEYHLLGILVEQAQGEKVSYRFILSELMRAFQFGWLVEIQEAASVLRPGVLTELNSLLEPGGRIELPNGKHIYRHPDTVVVITTNRGYAGNVALNEALRDRCLFGVAMDLPSAAVMASRAVSQLPGLDPEMALSAAKVIEAICSEAKGKRLMGSFGFRSLLGWCARLRAGDTSQETFLQRVVYKMTTEPETVQILLTCYRANSDFTSKTKRKGRAV